MKNKKGFSYIEVLISLFLTTVLISIIGVQFERISMEEALSSEIIRVTQFLRAGQMLVESNKMSEIYHWQESIKKSFLNGEGDLLNNEIELKWQSGAISVWHCDSIKSKNRSCLSLRMA